MSKDTISYNEKLNALRQEVEYYRSRIRLEILFRLELKEEIKELRRENARLAALVDARFTEHDWSESVGTE